MSPAAEPNWTRLAELLDAVIDLPPAQRESVYRRHEASREDIARLEAMLAREQTQGGALNRIIGQLATLDAGTASTAAGSVLGRWRLVRPLGEGGMASVWLAERADGSVEQQVAVKCLKAGLYSPELRALFAREQQILARLQHPHIARMYDSGIADNGLPYLVMERIDGESLTTWCDRQQLDPQQRLALFDQVLDALQFAHRELIVHRDLKPGNILVDQRGDLKLLDFGIARLMDDDSPDAPVTRYRALTPEYAAPEQLAGERVGLAADIFALGLLLHELLTGRKPSRDALQRELHPASAQVSRAEPGFDPVVSAQQRRRSPAALRRELSGDLDAIILRCLAERPQDRYPSVDGLRRDLEAWQARRPVSARRAGPMHRARLFLVRHWLPAAAVSLAALALLAGASLAIWQGWQAQSARAAMQLELERANTLNQFILDLFEGARLGLPRDQTPSTRELLLRGAEQARAGFEQNPELRAQLLALTGSLLLNVGLSVDAVDVLTEAVALPVASRGSNVVSMAEARLDLGRALHVTRGSAVALPELRLAVEALRGSGAPAPLARALHALGFALSDTMDFEGSLEMHQEALGLQRELDDPEALGLGLAETARSLQRAGRLQEAREAYGLALQYLRAQLGSQHYAVAMVLADYAVTLRRLGDFDQAERVAREALAASEGVYTGPHVTLVQRWNNLAVILATRGKRQEAIEALTQAMAVQERLHEGAFNSALVGMLNNLGVISLSVGDFDQAERHLLRATGALETAGETNTIPHVLVSHNLARTWLAQQRYDEAESLAQSALQQAQARWPESDERRSGLLSLLGQIQWQRDRDAAGLERIRQAHALMREHHGEDSDHTARRALELGEALLLVPDHEQARALFELTLRVSDAQFPPPHHQALGARLGLAEALIGLRRPDAARELLVPLEPLPPPELVDTDPLRARLLAVQQRLSGE